MKHFLLSSLLFSSASAFAPTHQNQLHLSHFDDNSFDPLNVASPSSNPLVRPSAVFLASLPVITTPSVALAATAGAADAIPSAVTAYGHYVSLVGLVACIMAERLTIKPNMTPEEEDFLGYADIGIGLWGVLIAYTGYLRATEYEKGFDFYSHEPLFWVKIAAVGVFGASSLFNTVTIITRLVAKQNGNFVPMGEKLSTRMKKICNAEIVAVSLIPLTATFMARGVGYSEDIPWQAEAGLDAAIFLGLSFKYVKEALSFEDNPMGDSLKD
jgi:putative membrane protein